MSGLRAIRKLTAHDGPRYPDYFRVADYSGVDAIICKRKPVYRYLCDETSSKPTSGPCREDVFQLRNFRFARDPGTVPPKILSP